MILYEIDERGQARPAKAVRIRDEAGELQELLMQNPFLLPGDQIDPESPRRWLVIRREMPVPDPGGGGARWSVDLLLSDQSGVPTFVECKRYADTRARREVVGQMLEYAANGHYYWDRADLRAHVEATATEMGRTVEEMLASLAPDDAETVDDLLERFVENLREGQVRLVFFMEEAPQELKSIVDFLNRQTERTEVLIVEARVFKSQGARFVVPSLFGYTEEARRAKRTVTVSSSESRRKWDEASFFEHASENLPSSHVAVLAECLRVARELGYSVNWGTGTLRGSFSLVSRERCPRSFVSLFSDGELWVNLGWLDGSAEAEWFRDRVVAAMTGPVGLVPKGTADDHWTYSIDDWISKSDAFLGAIRELQGDGGEPLPSGPVAG